MIAHDLGELVWILGTLAAALWAGVRLSDAAQQKANTTGASRLEYYVIPIGAFVVIMALGIVIGALYVV